MSKRDWVGTASIVALGFGAFFIAVAILGDVISEHRNRVHLSNAAYQQNAENDRRRSAHEIAQACNDLTFLQFRNCVSENLERHYQDQATNEDLQAQQDMALWAFWMFIATIGSVIVSGFGVALLIGTIRQGSRNLIKIEEANQIMRDDQRPWLKFEPRIELIEENGKSFLRMFIEAHNIGERPAFDIRLFAKVFEETDSGFDGIEIGDAEAMIQSAIAQNSWIKIAFRNDLAARWKDDFDFTNAPEKFFKAFIKSVAVAVTYKDSVSDERLFTVSQKQIIVEINEPLSMFHENDGISDFTLGTLPLFDDAK